MYQHTALALKRMREAGRTPAKYEIARLLDELCERENVSLSQLATMIGVNTSMLSRVRSGKREPRQRIILKMLSIWPITESERVSIGTYFKIIPPGYRIVRQGAVPID